MANENKYQYLFNMVFDSIIKTFNVDEDFLDKDVYDNHRRYPGTVHQWRYKGTPPKSDYYIDFLRGELEALLEEIIDKNKDELSPVIINFKQNSIRKFSNLIKNLEEYLVDKDPIDCALFLLDCCFDKNNTRKILNDGEVKVQDEKQQQAQKKPSPKLDESIIASLKTIGAEIETEDELYEMWVTLALNMLQEGKDDETAFRWLEDFYEMQEYQETICGFALMLYDKKDYARAFRLFSGLAQRGYATAQALVGECYHYGRGVNENLGIAYNWYAKVADLKDDENADIAQMGLVMCLLEMANKEDSDFLLQLAITATQKYAELGNAQVQYVLACAYRNGKGVKVNDDLALFWMGEAARNGLIDAIKIMNNEEA